MVVHICAVYSRLVLSLTPIRIQQGFACCRIVAVPVTVSSAEKLSVRTGSLTAQLQAQA